MAISGQRDSAPIVLRIKLRYHDADLFIRQLFRYVNRTGMFLRSPRPKPAGKRLIVVFKLANGESVFECEGYIRWVRPADGSMGPSGMGVEFVRLSPATRPVLEKIIKVRAQQGIAELREIPFSPEGFALPRRRAPSVPPMPEAEPADAKPADAKPADAKPAGQPSGASRELASKPADPPAVATPPAPATPPAAASSPPRPTPPAAAGASRPPAPQAGTSAAGQAKAIASMHELLARAEAEVPAATPELTGELADLIDGGLLDMSRVLMRARQLVAEPSSEEAFDELLVDALSSVSDGESAEEAAGKDSSAPIDARDRAATGTINKTDPTGKYESPREVVARLKRAAAKAAADAAAEKAAKQAASSTGGKVAEKPAKADPAAASTDARAPESAPGPATAAANQTAGQTINKTDPTGKYESPREVVARLKRAAAQAAKEVAEEAAEEAAAKKAAAKEAAAREAAAREAAAKETDENAERAGNPAQASADSAAAPTDPADKSKNLFKDLSTRRESPKEVVARLKRAAAEAAAREAVKAAAEAAKADKGKKETPKEVVARLKRAAAEAAAAEPVPDEPPTKKESPKEVVARLKRAAALAKFKPPSEIRYDISKIPRVDGIPAGVVEVSEPEIRIVPDDDELAAPTPYAESAGEGDGDEGLLPAAARTIPLSELEPVAPIAKQSDPRELADDDFPDIETVDQPGIDREFLDVGSMASPGPAPDIPESQLPDIPESPSMLDGAADLPTAEDAEADSVFGDDFDFDSMFDAAVGPAALEATPDIAFDLGATPEVGDFGVDLLSDDDGLADDSSAPGVDRSDDGKDIADGAEEPDPEGLDALEIGDEYAINPLLDDSLLDDERGDDELLDDPLIDDPLLDDPLVVAPLVVDPPIDDRRESAVNDGTVLEVSSEQQSGPLDAIPAVLISDDSKGLDIDHEIQFALESLSGNIKVPPHKSELDFDIDAAFESAVAPDPVADDVKRERAGTSSIDISFSDDDDDDALFDTSGPSGLELALQSDDPLMRRSSQVIAPSDVASHGQDPTMILDDLDAVQLDEQTGAPAAGSFGNARDRNSLSLEFDAGALDAEGLMATDMSGLASQHRGQADPALGAEPTLANESHRPSGTRKPPLPAPPLADESGEENLDDMLEELALDDEELLLVEDDQQASRPPPPPSGRPSAPPPPTPTAPDADDLAASEFGFGGDLAAEDDGDEPKKRGFFGRFFKK